ncbi:MAG: isoprenyl transferase [Deltaproteobacteria bacterium]|nr:isoprenyl transferase [Deltaproteobacteria bacterium]
MEGIDQTNLPRHVAIIMDGNGRWASKNALRRVVGHKRGAQAVRSAVRTCRELGIQYLTLFAFSVENWNRPADEVEALMALLEDYLSAEVEDLKEKGIRLATIGDIDALSCGVRHRLAETMRETEQGRSMVLTLALSYGSRDEIVETVRSIIDAVTAGTLCSEDITKETFSNHLYTKNMPDPDLLIRTSGEYRLSNFLLWQSAYAELYFTPVLWPDFTRENLLDAIRDYQCRERRFGLTSDQLTEK